MPNTNVYTPKPPFEVNTRSQAQIQYQFIRGGSFHLHQFFKRRVDKEAFELLLDEDVLQKESVGSAYLGFERKIFRHDDIMRL